MFGLTVGLTTRAPRPAPGVVWAIDLDLATEASESDGGIFTVDGDNDLVFSAEAIESDGGALSFTEIINLDVGDAEPVVTSGGVLITIEDLFFLADPINSDGGEVTVPGTAAAITLTGSSGPGKLLLSGDAGGGALLVTYLTETVSLTAEPIESVDGTLSGEAIQALALSGSSGPGRIKLSGDAQESGNDLLLTKETI